MRLTVLTMPAALLLFLCIACHNRSNHKTPVNESATRDALIAGSGAAWDKKIIKTADLNIEVKNFKVFTDRLHRAVKQSGGYISQEQQTQSLSAIENTVTIKVPVDQFDDILPAVASDSDRLVEKKISSEDVTTQLVDTRSRLETKKEVRERYLELLRRVGLVKLAGAGAYQHMAAAAAGRIRMDGGTQTSTARAADKGGAGW